MMQTVQLQDLFTGDFSLLPDGKIHLNPTSTAFTDNTSIESDIDYASQYSTNSGNLTSTSGSAPVLATNNDGMPILTVPRGV